MSYPYERGMWMAPEQLKDVELLATLLTRGDTFVDVGANVGIWSITAGGIVGEDGMVIAVEPGAVGSQLALNLADNPAHQSVLHRVAVGAEDGHVQFDEGGAFHNIGRVVEGGDSEVEMRRLDDLLDGHFPALIKIDVEGLELEVLRGAESTLERSGASVIVEFTPSEGAGSLGAWGVHRWLAQRGYRASRMPSLEPVGGGWEADPGQGHMNLLYRRA